MPDYKVLPEEFVNDRPQLWDELVTHRHDKLIRQLRRSKRRNYPADRRGILVAGIKPGKQVHVEFLDEPPEMATPARATIVKLQ